MMLFGVIFCLSLMSVCSGQTIDQLISASARSSRTEDLFYDSNTVQVEYDMLFSLEDWAEIQRLNDDTNRVKRNALRDVTKRWRGRTVPYVISGAFSSYDRGQVQAAINDYHSYTCLKFRPATSSDYNRISLQNGGGCASYVGMVGGQQVVTLAPGCRRKGIIIHELGHAIGFHHEQTRPDRDSYVTILTQNIHSHTLYNFQRYSSRVINTYGVPYDYRSIMHYGQYAFSRNGRPTILTKDSSKQHLIGNRYDFSFRDVKLVNLMYSCDSHCINKPTCPGEGFVGKDCKCKCPGNPVKDCDGTGTGGGGGGGGGGGKECEDNHRNCASWAGAGECTRNPGYMLVNCKASCRQCDGGGGGGGQICVDANQNCNYWARAAYCRHWYYGTYMKTNCKKSCNLCDSTAAGTTGSGAESTSAAAGSTSPNVGTTPGAETTSAGAETTSAGAGTTSDGTTASTSSPTTVAPSSTTTAPSPTVDPLCQDNNVYCSSWASTGECSRNPAYMLQFCRRSCGVCKRRKK